MRNHNASLAMVCAIALAATAGVYAQPDAIAAPTGAPEVGGEPLPPPPCGIMTIAKGELCAFQHDNPNFMGADLVIRDPDAWMAFWAALTGENNPPPPVDFRRDVVIAAMQGPQPTQGGPNISIVDVNPEGPFATVVIVDDERPGDLPACSNPFHVVAVCRQVLRPHRSLNFLHVRPMPEAGTVVGRVLAAWPDEDPGPLPGAHVMLASENSEPRHAVSGRDGSYFFVNVPPAPYVLIAEHPGFEPAEFPIEIPPNALVAHDFILTPQPPPPPGTIQGQVLGANPDGDPLPLPNSRVDLFRDEEPVAHRITNDDGFFVFEEVPPGGYRLVASHEGFIPQEFIAEVEPEGVVQHTFILPRHEACGAFLGRVMGLLDNTRQVPLAGALVQLLGPDGVVREVQTDRRGRFAMLDVPPGPYLARAEAEGWAPEEADVEIVPGEPTCHVFRLHRLPGLSEK